MRPLAGTRLLASPSPACTRYRHLIVRKGATKMTLVVKIGGAAGMDTHTNTIARDVAQLIAEGERVVLLHGGSDLTNALCERLGLPVRTITSPEGMTSRYTDEQTLQVYVMAVAGQINTELVALLQSQGVNALGLSVSMVACWWRGANPPCAPSCPVAVSRLFATTTQG